MERKNVERSLTPAAEPNIPPEPDLRDNRAGGVHK